jgi:hypothetical protein
LQFFTKYSVRFCYILDESVLVFLIPSWVPLVE